jgi:hypothetical protein
MISIGTVLAVDSDATMFLCNYASTIPHYSATITTSHLSTTTSPFTYHKKCQGRPSAFWPGFCPLAGRPVDLPASRPGPSLKCLRKNFLIIF